MWVVPSRLLRPRVRLAGAMRSSFHVAAALGLVCGLALALALSAFRGISMVVTAELGSVAVAASTALAVATRVLIGREVLVLYQHVAAALAAVALALWVPGRPIVVPLEVVAVGIAAFLAVGRLGCAAVGCCHGRPAARGVVYRAEHAEEGFPRWLVGVPLVPVQLLEAAALVAIAALGSVIVSFARPGAALIVCVVAYLVVRFALESARGDARPSYRGLSHTQWVALMVVATLAVTNPRPGLVAVAVAMASVAVFCANSSRRLDHRVRAPRHLAELAGALSSVAAGADPIVRATSLVRVSGGSVDGPGGPVVHYTVSRPDSALDEATARVLGGLIARLRHRGAVARVVPGDAAVVHILIGPPPRVAYDRSRWRNAGRNPAQAVLSVDG